MTAERKRSNGRTQSEASAPRTARRAGNRISVVASALFVVTIATVVAVATVAGSAGGVVAPGATTPDTTNGTVNETANDTAPTVPSGARLGGVIGAQEAEHDAAVESRSFERAYESAPTNDSKAAVVASRSERIRERLHTLQTESDRLEQAYTNGTVTAGTYYGQKTALGARIEALERQANRTSESARSLPDASLAARGLNRSDLATLENRTRSVGPRRSAVVRSIAGPSVGIPAGPPETVPGNARDGPDERRDSQGEPPAPNQNGTNGTTANTPGGSNVSEPGRAHTEHEPPGRSPSDATARDSPANHSSGTPAPQEESPGRDDGTDTSEANNETDSSQGSPADESGPDGDGQSRSGPPTRGTGAEKHPPSG